MLFPVFAQAREKARQITCISNLKQLGLGFLQYNQDYDEFMPRNTGNGGQGWAGQIYPYTKTNKVFVCPDDKTTDLIKNTNCTTDTRFVACSYAFNENLDAPQNNSKPLIVSRFTAPASTVVLFEVTGGHANRTGNNPNVSSIDIAETASPSGEGSCSFNSATSYATGPLARRTNCSATVYPAPRHMNGSNYLASDGHAKWLTGDKVSTYDINPSPGNPQGVPTANVAAGADNMTDTSGNSFALTFSQI